MVVICIECDRALKLLWQNSRVRLRCSILDDWNMWILWNLLLIVLSFYDCLYVAKHDDGSSYLFLQMHTFVDTSYLHWILLHCGIVGIRVFVSWVTKMLSLPLFLMWLSVMIEHYQYTAACGGVRFALKNPPSYVQSWSCLCLHAQQGSEAVGSRIILKLCT